MSRADPRQPQGRDRQTMAVAAIVVLQAIGAIFFVADAIGDLLTDGFGAHIMVECVISFALVAGVIFGARAVRFMLVQARQRNEALAIASGALADLIHQRFATWKLTKGEADVALFALKGCSITQIAELRGTAEGTVRAQLARVYAKAHVTSQAGLVSLFFEDLLDPLPA